MRHCDCATANEECCPVKIPPGGLIESIAPSARGLSGEFPRLREQVAHFIEQVSSPEDHAHVGGDAPFRENPSLPPGQAGLETTVWALACLQQTGQPQRIERVRDRALAHIDRYYDPESRTYEDDNARAHHSFGAWHSHNDVVARIGLSILNQPPRGTGQGVEYLRYHPWAPPPGSDIDAWMRQCWDKDPRAALKEIYQYLLLYCTLMRIGGAAEFDAHVRHIVDFLESRRDPDSGYIGMAAGNDLGWAMRGYRNFVINFYWPMGVAEPMLDRMIDSTLACQRDDGLFHDGGMCANMDAVQLLAEYSLRSGLRRAEVIDACRRCARALFEKMLVRSCGGFRFNFNECRASDVRDYGKAQLTNGTAFALYTLRFWQAIDDDARRSLQRQLDDIGAG